MMRVALNCSKDTTTRESHLSRQRTNARKMRRVGTQGVQLTPKAIGAWQKAEIAQWRPMIKAANVKVE
jgi:hypothetical protein